MNTQTTFYVRVRLAVAMAVALLAAFALVRGNATAQPDEAVLGTYPTGNFTYGFMDQTNPLSEVFSPSNIIIDHVGAGIIDIDPDDLVSIGRLDASTDPDAAGAEVFTIDHDFTMTIDANRGGRVRGYGDTAATVQSLLTGETFTWEPRVAIDARCVERGSWEADDERLSRCTEFEVEVRKTGAISGLGGRGTCGTLDQVYGFSMHFEFEEKVYSPVFRAPEGRELGTGTLSLSNDRCVSAVYGVMPGDNVKMARVSVAGTSSTDGRTTVYELQFEGQLRDRTEVRGTMTAALTIRGGVAAGEVIDGEIRVGGDAPVEIEGGALRLDDVRTRGDTLTGHGTLEYLASETEGVSNG